MTSGVTSRVCKVLSLNECINASIRPVDFSQQGYVLDSKIVDHLCCCSVALPKSLLLIKLYAERQK